MNDGEMPNRIPPGNVPSTLNIQDGLKSKDPTGNFIMSVFGSLFQDLIYNPGVS